MNTIGHNIKITFFGESHGSHIGLVIDQLPAGIPLNEELIKFNLSKRRPQSDISTPRQEKDAYQIISGLFNGYTTGGALTIVIENKDVKSKDYTNLNNTPRPSHSDYPAFVKYRGFNDYRGGGFFSGRMTALWVIAGSIAQQILEKEGIYVGSHILQLKDVSDQYFSDVSDDTDIIKRLNQDVFPLINPDIKDQMMTLIRNAKSDNDSVGGVVESKAVSLPVGLGEPYFHSVESYLSQLMFSIPAVKGVSFGDGFAISEKFGSEVNDAYRYIDDKIKTLNNHNGGILGGLTNGSPLMMKVAFKPTSSIGKKQKTVNLKDKTDSDLIVEGRHDPQIVSRAVHVVTCVLNFGLLDLLLFNIKKEDLKCLASSVRD